mgnify:FL=1
MNDFVIIMNNLRNETNLFIELKFNILEILLYITIHPSQVLQTILADIMSNPKN